MKFVNFIKGSFQKFLYSKGYEVFRIAEDISSQDMQIINQVRPFTVTDTSALKSLIHSVKHIIENNIPGDFVECGVWRGGSIITIIKVLQQMGIKDRTIHLFDTFEGLNSPTEVDVRVSGEIASESDYVKLGEDPLVKFDSVVKRIQSEGYPQDKIIFHKGEVEQTLQKNSLDCIALLRLDTDWYESTKIEMEVLYPKVVNGGIVIIDDYGIWKGAKQAVDEYFKDDLPYLHYVDYSCRVIIKS